MSNKFFFLFLFFILLSFIESHGTDYYKILGISKTASKRQIKKSYRKLAVRYHPDRVKGNEKKKKKAQQKFIKIAKAYEVLSDDKKRKIYDRFGEEGLKEGGGGRGGFGGFDPSSIFSQFFGGGDDDDHFSFGGGGRGSGFEEQDENSEENFTGEDLNIPIDLSLEDLYAGRLFPFNRVRQSHEKNAQPRPCKCRLGNTVRMVIVNGAFKRIRDKDCSNCQDRFKVFKTSSKLLVEVEPGMMNKDRITFYGKGDATKAKRAGNLNFIVRELPHAVFDRDGNDLKVVMQITLKEALVGFTRKIKHLDGRTVIITHNKVVVPGSIKDVKNEGMPIRHDSENKGSLLIKLLVKFPDSLTDKQKNSLKSIM